MVNVNESIVTLQKDIKTLNLVQELKKVTILDLAKETKELENIENEINRLREKTGYINIEEISREISDLLEQKSGQNYNWTILFWEKLQRFVRLSFDKLFYKLAKCESLKDERERNIETIRESLKFNEAMKKLMDENEKIKEDNLDLELKINYVRFLLNTKAIEELDEKLQNLERQKELFGSRLELDKFLVLQKEYVTNDKIKESMTALQRKINTLEFLNICQETSKARTKN